MIAEPAADCDQAALVRRDDQLERHVTDGHLIACGRDAPAIEQQVFIRLQSLFPADCGAVDVLNGLADRIMIGRRRRIGAGESDCNRGEPPGRQRSCRGTHGRIFEERTAKARRY